MFGGAFATPARENWPSGALSAIRASGEKGADLGLGQELGSAAPSVSGIALRATQQSQIRFSGDFMKLKTLAVALVASTIAGSAFAADLPSRKVAPVMAPVPVMTWTGFYVGLNAGYTWSGNGVATTPLAGFFGPTWNTELATSAALATGVDSPKSSGFIGGLQAGYNHQFGALVAGIETDIQGVIGKGSSGARIGAGVPAAFPAELITSSSTSSRKLDYFGTLRARFGFVATPSFLLYATGGLAYGGAKASTSIVQFDANNGVPGNAPYGSFGSYSGTKLGWTVGAGGEWKFAQNWSAKLEYLYYDLGNATYSSLLAFTAPPGFNPPGYGSVLSHTTKFNGHIVRAGLNYHFGGGAGPVVAKY